ncbi:MAG: hypothetical protein IJ390_03645 [Lachnospiraceae bacterium]|nr:hypothetical protein [Lachnospiraceae bacterium]
MQDLSFKQENTFFQTGRYMVSVSLYTFENVYTLSPDHTEITQTTDGLCAECRRLMWAGGQESADGEVSLKLHHHENLMKIMVKAKMARAKDALRRIKVSIHGLERGRIINSIDVNRSEIGPEGLTITYPEGWRECGTPLVIMESGQEKIWFGSLDDQVRRKMFVFVPETDSTVTAELIFEEDALYFSNVIQVPAWEIGCGNGVTVEEIYKRHMAHVESSYGLESWEQRTDVPDWAKKISLVAAIHGQHWTGRIFNDYRDMLCAIEKLASMMDGRSILAYLPGWEGRYYWQYGDYRPDERMGGEAGFKRLCDGAREMGVHLMPMFGMTHGGKHLGDYQRWGTTSELTSPSGNRSNGSVDWDGSRHYDHSSNGCLNPGAPQWQNRLCSQICELIDTYDFDGVFLDILASWNNDPNFNCYDGVKNLIRRLKEGRPELLIAGEGWYDGLMKLVGIFQSGHTDGHMHYHDAACPAAFTPYAREFGHLCLGDPARLSTGVHEQGYNPEWKTPLREGVIPTITIVDGSLENAADRVAEIVALAKEYDRRFLK